MRLLALFFHRVSDRPSPADVYTISRAYFTSIFDEIESAALPVVELPEPYLHGASESTNATSLAITFDDGWASDYRVAFPVLGEHGYKATFFVPTTSIGTKGHVTWRQLRKMVAEGMTIGSHSHTHVYLSTLSEDEIRTELITSKKLLEDKLGIPIMHVSVPGGAIDERVYSIAIEVGYRAICTSSWGINSFGSLEAPLLMKRICVDQRMSMEELQRLLRGERLWRREIAYSAKMKIKRMFGYRIYRHLIKVHRGIRATWSQVL